MCALCIGNREGDAIAWRSVNFPTAIMKPARWMRPGEKEALFGVNDPGVWAINDAPGKYY